MYNLIEKIKQFDYRNFFIIIGAFLLRWFVKLLGISFIAFPLVLLIFFTETNKITIWEKRAYVILTIYCFMAIAFGVLRIYNSVVANSSMLNKLTQGLKKFETSISSFERETKNNSNKLSQLVQQLSNKIDSLKSVINAKK